MQYSLLFRVLKYLFLIGTVGFVHPLSFLLELCQNLIDHDKKQKELLIPVLNEDLERLESGKRVNKRLLQAITHWYVCSVNQTGEKKETRCLNKSFLWNK